MTTAFVVIARPPQWGQVKSRLVPAIGQRRTLQLYRALLADVCHAILSHSSNVFIYWSNEAYLKHFMDGLPSGQMRQFIHRLQVPGDLGAKMSAVFTNLFGQGFQRVVLVGSDFPYLTPALLWKAETALMQTPVVVGPANDGGYYLIGLQRPFPFLFQTKPWSQPNLLAATLDCCKEHQVSYQLLPVGSDIDHFADIIKLAACSQGFGELSGGVTPYSRRVLKQMGLL